MAKKSLLKRRFLEDGTMVVETTAPENPAAPEPTLEEQLTAAQAELDSLMAIPEWTPEQQARAQELTDIIAALEAAIAEAAAAAAAPAPEAVAQEAAALRARYAGRQATLSRPLGRKTGSSTSTAAPAHLAFGRQTENFTLDPKKGFKSHREFLSKVIDAGRGHKLDSRLKYLAAGSDEARGNSDPDGGFLVPEGFSPNLLQIAPEADPLSGLTTSIPMENPIVKIPARADKNHNTSVSGGLTVTRRPETVAGSSSKMTLEQVALEAHSLFGISYATEELLSDSPISFAALLAAGFSDQFTAHLINERISGSGIGEFLGVLNSPCLISQAAEAGQATDTILYENAVKMRARCWGYGKAVWLANHDTLPQLMLMNQAVGAGGAPVWQPSAREDHPDLLFGRPLVFTEFCKTLGDVGDLLLGNWAEYLEGTYQPLQSEESIHVRFVNHERTFKFWLRNAGQPWWKSALTPRNSTTTLSPFVALAAR